MSAKFDNGGRELTAEEMRERLQTAQLICRTLAEGLTGRPEEKVSYSEALSSYYSALSSIMVIMAVVHPDTPQNLIAGFAAAFDVYREPKMQFPN